MFEFRSWGGARRDAGRKPAGPRSRVTHAQRGEFARPVPVHVTLRIRTGLPSLRETRAHDALRAALLAGAERAEFRVVHYSAQTSHLHFICEASSPTALSRGVQGLTVRIARAVNRAWGRGGKLFADRFHSRLLRSPREVRYALAYVLGNAQKHGFCVPGGVDPCSSAAWRDGLGPAVECATAGSTASEAPVVAEPRTWRLAIGWRRWGLLPRSTV